MGERSETGLETASSTQLQQGRPRPRRSLALTACGIGVTVAATALIECRPVLAIVTASASLR